MINPTHCRGQRTPPPFVLLLRLLCASVLALAPAFAQLSTVSSADFHTGPLASGSIVSSFGQDLAGSTVSAQALPLPTELAGVSISIIDSAGQQGLAGLLFASPNQANWLIPDWVADGDALVTLTKAGGAPLQETLRIARVRPGIFTADGSGGGTPAALALRTEEGGARKDVPVFSCPGGNCAAHYLEIGPPSEVFVLTLFATGIRNGGAATVTVDGVEAEVFYSGPQPEFVGLDQIDVRMPPELRGEGEVDVQVSVDGVVSNSVSVILGPKIPEIVEPVKIAFISDSESLQYWEEVLELIRSEGADFVLEQGDYYGDGGTNFEQWRQPIGSILDASAPGNLFPFLGPPTGKRFPDEQEDYFRQVADELEAEGARWEGCIEANAPQKGSTIDMDGCDADEGGRSGDFWLRWKGMTFMFQNQEPDVDWAQQVLRDDLAIWKLCLWHGNHLDFNAHDKGFAAVGDGDSSLPYQMYRGCADLGGLIFNGNTHQYTRTCPMTDIGAFNHGGPLVWNRVNRDPSAGLLQDHGPVCPSAGAADGIRVDAPVVGPGQSMVLIASGAGHDLREYRHTMRWPTEEPQDNFRHDGDNWWSTILSNGRYCRNNCTAGDLSGQDRSVDKDFRVQRRDNLEGHGVLFITFNEDRNGAVDPFKAYGYFKTISIEGGPSRILDEFEVTYDPTTGPARPEMAPRPGPRPPDSSGGGQGDPSNGDASNGGNPPGGPPNPGGGSGDPGATLAVTTSEPGEFCLDRTGQRQVLQGQNLVTEGQSRYVDFQLPDNAVIDARGATWNTTVSFPFDLGGVPGGVGNACVSGGSIIGGWDPLATTWSHYHSTSAIGARVANFLLENVYVENFGDGIRIANRETDACEIQQDANHFVIRGVHFKDMRDDCVENDWGRSGLIVDSFFDGCFSGFSTRAGSDCARQLPDRDKNVVEIRDSLVWMKPLSMLDQNGQLRTGNAELFKDDSDGPQWALHNNVFRADASLLNDLADEIGYGVRRAGGQIGDPNTKLYSCSNNVFVWLGDGDLPPPYDNKEWRTPLPWLKDPTTGESCFTFTKDKAVWDAAVDAWLAVHNSGTAF